MKLVNGRKIRSSWGGTVLNSVNKTLYIPLYGKALVSKQNKFFRDKKAEEIWAKEGFELKGKSKSKWLAYYMAMRSAIYDEWVEEKLKSKPNATVLQVGCGLDSRIERVPLEQVSAKHTQWYDIDFPDVIQERRKYFEETDDYHMLGMDMREAGWQKQINQNDEGIIVLEGVSMYFEPAQLSGLLSSLSEHFKSISVLMDCYTEQGANMSKYKNPINDVGVTEVYGYDHPEELGEKSHLVFVKEYDMTPQKYMDELKGVERFVFKNLFAGKIAKSMYRMYEYKTVSDK